MLFKKKRLDFIGIGAQKCGTSALFKYLARHPEIGLGRTKEVHFFDYDRNFKRLFFKYKKYHAYFDFGEEGKKRFGEVTPIYIYWKPALERIKEYNPAIKLILILRNPKERAFSHWNMDTSRNWEDRDFYTCITEEPLNGKQHRVKSYIRRGMYVEQLQRLFSLFDKEQVLILKYENFLNAQQNTLNQVFDFLNVEKKAYEFEPLTTNKIPYEEKIDPKSKVFLDIVFKEEIKKVEDLLHWDCSDWKE